MADAKTFVGFPSFSGCFDRSANFDEFVERLRRAVKQGSDAYGQYTEEECLELFEVSLTKLACYWSDELPHEQGDILGNTIHSFRHLLVSNHWDLPYTSPNSIEHKQILISKSVNTLLNGLPREKRHTHPVMNCMMILQNRKMIIIYR